MAATASLQGPPARPKHAGALDGESNLHRRFTAIAGHPLFAYGAILLLQYCRMWGIFQYHVLTGGDTSSYYNRAFTWFHEGRGDFAWSPLYTAFYGALLHLSPDAAFVTALHRVLIACAATVLVLAIMRKMLPAPLAWLVAAWWAILPNDFDTRYEIHLFALLPILAAWLAILARRGSIGRAIAIAIFLLAAFLVRNEMLVPTACLALACAALELRDWRHAAPQTRPTALIRTALSYFVPLAAALGVVAWFFHHSNVTGSALRAQFAAKHAVNMGQVFAFGYQQRHPDWKADPWTEYGQLCTREFGTPAPTLWQMATRSPPAYAAHVLWNFSLLPNALQNMLFNATSGSRDPDYGGRLGQAYPIPLTILALSVMILGLRALKRHWRFWWPAWVRPRLEGWIAMLAVIAVCLLVVIPTQRPASAYLFGMTLFLMCVIATCAMPLFRGARRFYPFMPLLMLALPLCVRSAYTKANHARQKSVYAEYQLLRSYGSAMERPDAVFLGALPFEMRNYVAHGQPTLRWYDYRLLKQLGAGESLAHFLGSRQINLLELNSEARQQIDAAHPGAAAQFLAHLADSGWTIVGSRTTESGMWYLLGRDRRNVGEAPPRRPAPSKNV